MPYIYSLAAQVYFEDATIMRSLLFDFADDEAAKKIWDEFLFGKNLLICPVLEPLYYEKESRKLENLSFFRLIYEAGKSCIWQRFIPLKRNDIILISLMW